MSKKLQGNGLFESSRMMLPEHKEAYILHQQTLMKKERPRLDAQETDHIARLIADSMLNAEPVTLSLYDEYENQLVTGRVVEINQPTESLKLTTSAGRSRWVKFKDITAADSANAV